MLTRSNGSCANYTVLKVSDTFRHQPKAWRKTTQKFRLEDKIKSSLDSHGVYFGVPKQ